jgi:hypothetical protein
MEVCIGMEVIFLTSSAVPAAGMAKVTPMAL